MFTVLCQKSFHSVVVENFSDTFKIITPAISSTLSPSPSALPSAFLLPFLSSLFQFLLRFGENSKTIGENSKKSVWLWDNWFPHCKSYIIFLPTQKYNLMWILNFLNRTTKALKIWKSKSNIRGLPWWPSG